MGDLLSIPIREYSDICGSAMESRATLGVET